MKRSADAWAYGEGLRQADAEVDQRSDTAYCVTRDPAVFLETQRVVWERDWDACMIGFILGVPVGALLVIAWHLVR